MCAMLGRGTWAWVDTHATASPFYSAATKIATTEATNSFGNEKKD